MTPEEIDAEEQREREARRERRRLEAESSAKAKPEKKGTRAHGERAPRSLKYPVVLQRWLELPDDPTPADILRAMCEVAGVPKAVIDDRMPAVEKASARKFHTKEQAKKS